MSQSLLDATLAASESPIEADPLDSPQRFSRPISAASSGASMALHRQWISRPAEERYESLNHLAAAVQSERERSISRLVQLQEVRPIVNGDGLAFQLPRGKQPRIPTDWGWNQFAGFLGVPPQYLASLPPDLAVRNLEHGIKRVGPCEIQTLETQSASGGLPSLRSVTSRGWGRIWDVEVLESLQELAGSGTGEMGWTVPTAFRTTDAVAAREARPITIEDSTIYRGDRDMWIFLADESRPFELGKTADGNPDVYFRGFAAFNSEVGNGSACGVLSYLYRWICGNRMIHGIGKLEKLQIRHSANAPQRFREVIVPALREYADSSIGGIEEAYAAAKKKVVARNDESRMQFLKSLKFSKSECEGILSAVLAETQGRPLETTWDAIQGITAMARDVPYQADRIAVERVAAKLMVSA